MDGSINDKSDGRLPGAKYSLVDLEYETWSSFGIFGEREKNDQLYESMGHPTMSPQHQFMNDEVNGNNNSYYYDNDGSGLMSTVATSIYNKDGMRNCGIVLFVCTLLSLLLLINAAQNRRLEREIRKQNKNIIVQKQVKVEQQSKKKKENNQVDTVKSKKKKSKKKILSLATDQGVNRMLKRSHGDIMICVDETFGRNAVVESNRREFDNNGILTDHRSVTDDDDDVPCHFEIL
jgi:hypothetical protein